MIRPSDASHSSTAITNTGELIGALPLLLGFHPTNSLVLVTQSSSKPTLSGVIRVDLPAPQEVPGLVAQLRDVLVTGGVVVVTAIVVCGHFPGPDSVPQRIVVDALTVGLRAVGVTIRHLGVGVGDRLRHPLGVLRPLPVRRLRPRHAHLSVGRSPYGGWRDRRGQP